MALINQLVVRSCMLCAVLLIGVAGVYSNLGLYADGSYFLLKILSEGGYWDFDKPRAFAQIATQTPVVFAIKLGVRDLGLLARLHSAGLIALPIAVWVVALFLQIRSRYFYTLIIAFAATYLTAGFFAVGEFNLAYSIVALCTALIYRRDLGAPGGCVLVFAAFVLSRSYEALLFLGPCLMLMSLCRLYKSPHQLGVFGKVALITAAVLFAVATILSGFSILFPRDPSNLAGAVSTARLFGSPHIAYVILMTLIYFVLGDPIGDRFARTLVVLAFIFSGAYLALQAAWPEPALRYEYRVAGGLILSLVLCMTLIEMLRTSDYSSYMNSGGSSDTAAFAAIMLFFCTLWPFLLTVQRYASCGAAFERESVSASEWKPLEKSEFIGAKGDCRSYIWPWISPSMSLILRGDHSGGISNNTSYTGWQPFEPGKLEENPLAAYERSTKRLFSHPMSDEKGIPTKQELQ